MSKVRMSFSETALTSIMVSQKENKTHFFNKIMSTPPKVQNGKQFIELLRKELSIQECLVTQPFLLSSTDIYKQLVFSHEVGVLAKQQKQDFQIQLRYLFSWQKGGAVCFSSLMCQECSSFPKLPGKYKGKGLESGVWSYLRSSRSLQGIVCKGDYNQVFQLLVLSYLLYQYLHITRNTNQLR